MERDELLEKLSDELDVTVDIILDYFGSQHWDTAQKEGADMESFDDVLACLEQYFFG
jgi:hypothetical protein